MSEHKIQDAVRAYVCSLPNARVWRNNNGLDRERGIKYGLGKGSPDLVGIVNGRFLGLEIKTATGRPSREQLVWLQMIRDLGGVSAIVRSVDEARAVIAEVERGER